MGQYLDIKSSPLTSDGSLVSLDRKHAYYYQTNCSESMHTVKSLAGLLGYTRGGINEKTRGIGLEVAIHCTRYITLPTINPSSYGPLRMAFLKQSNYSCILVITGGLVLTLKILKQNCLCHQNNYTKNTIPKKTMAHSYKYIKKVVSVKKILWY